MKRAACEGSPFCSLHRMTTTAGSYAFTHRVVCYHPYGRMPTPQHTTLWAGEIHLMTVILVTMPFFPSGSEATTIYTPVATSRP